jgi:hypothetical protein
LARAEYATDKELGRDVNWSPGDSKRYRDRAKDLRTKADLFSPENRAMLLNMAGFYDHFADEAEMEPRARPAPPNR